MITLFWKKGKNIFIFFFKFFSSQRDDASLTVRVGGWNFSTTKKFAFVNQAQFAVFKIQIKI